MAQAAKLKKSVKTPEEVLRLFRANGVCIADWAATNGFKAKSVYAVLYGNRKCVRGQSYEIAIRLEMKAPGTYSFQKP